MSTRMPNLTRDNKTSNQARRDSSTLNQPERKMDSAEYQKEIEIAAMYANKDRRGSDRLGELHTFVGARFDSVDYSRRAD